MEVVEYSVLYMYNIGGNKLGDKGVYQIVQHLKFIPHLENLYLCTINYLKLFSTSLQYYYYYHYFISTLRKYVPNI